MSLQSYLPSFNINTNFVNSNFVAFSSIITKVQLYYIVSYWQFHYILYCVTYWQFHYILGFVSYWQFHYILFLSVIDNSIIFCFCQLWTVPLYSGLYQLLTVHCIVTIVSYRLLKKWTKKYKFGKKYWRQSWKFV